LSTRFSAESSITATPGPNVKPRLRTIGRRDHPQLGIGGGAPLGIGPGALLGKRGASQAGMRRRPQPESAPSPLGTRTRLKADSAPTPWEYGPDSLGARTEMFTGRVRYAGGRMPGRGGRPAGLTPMGSTASLTHRLR